VEIEVVESNIDASTNIEDITKFILLGITLLGNDVSEGIEGSHLDTIDLIGVEQSENFVKFKREFFSALNKDKNIEKAENLIVPKIEDIKATLEVKILYNKVSFNKSVKKENGSKMKRYKDMPDKYRIFGTAGNHMILFCDGGMFACPEPDADDMEFSEEAVKPFEMTATIGDQTFGLNTAVCEYAIESEKKMAEVTKMAEEKAEMSKQVEEYGVKAGLYEEEKAKFAEMEKSYEEEKSKFAKLSEEYEVVKMSQFEADARKVMADDNDADDETKKEFETRMKNKEFKTVEEFEKEFAYAKYKKAKMAKKPAESEKITYALTTPVVEKPVVTDVFEMAKKAVDAISK
jgi:hypothetical protein